MVTHLFTTPLLREATGMTPEQREEVCAYLLTLRGADPSDVKSNRGGWHSQGNLFTAEHQQFPAMRDVIIKTLFAYISEVFGFRGEIQFSMNGWSVVNRPGDYNVPHNHAANLLSGVLYLRIPEKMSGGAIAFLDPRLNLNAHDSEGLRRMGVKPPWMKTSTAVVPVPGEIIIFPSWLNHWVEPYQCPDPSALRIVVSFNAVIR